MKNLNSIGKKNTKALEQLSSGLRINRAADDAAGVAISAKMRSQIRGLEQAGRNIQDGISFVQVADGALSTVHSILQRGKELCVQAANDTNTDADRQQINAELAQLSDQIDKIGSDTEFNTIHVFLKGGASIEDAEMIKMVAEVWVASALDAIHNTFSAFAGAGSGEALDIALGSLGPNVGAMMSSNFTLTLNTDVFDPGQTGANNDSGGSIGGTMYDQIIAHEMMHAVMFDTFDPAVMASIPLWFIEGSAEAVSGGFDRIRGLTNAEVLKDLTALDTSATYASGYAAAMYLGSLAGGGNIAAGLNTIYTELASGKSFDQALQDISTIAMTQNTFETTMFPLIGGGALNNLRAAVGAGTGSVVASSLTTDAEGTIIDAKNEDTSANYFTVSSELWADALARLVIHIGPNTDQHINLDRFGLSANLGLGVPEPSTLGTQASYNNAISAYDKAGDKVSTMRSYYGALQNRLEYAGENAAISAVNTQAAESRIRDVSMSKIMTEFTKTNIISQSAMAMLAQANQLPNNILSLLR